MAYIDLSTTYYYQSVADSGPPEPVRLVRPKPDHFFQRLMGNGRLFHGKDRQIINRACL